MWLFDQARLRQQELTTGSKLQQAIEGSRKLSFLQRRHALQLVNADSRWLHAVSPMARVRWGKMICEEMSQHFHLGPDRPEPDQRVFLVTLCDRRCCTSHQEKRVDISRFKRLLSRGLRGLSYLGMLEPAYYVNVCEGTHVDGKRLVCWHVHLLPWGESRKEMEKRINRLNDRRILLPIADRLAAAHQKCISKGYLASKVAYILKAPRKAYRLYKKPHVTSAGEIILRFTQKKDDLRPGERLTLFRLLQEMHLDQLALGGGEGAKILRRLRRGVLRDLSN